MTNMMNSAAAEQEAVGLARESFLGELKSLNRDHPNTGFGVSLRTRSGRQYLLANSRMPLPETKSEGFPTGRRLARLENSERFSSIEVLADCHTFESISPRCRSRNPGQCAESDRPNRHHDQHANRHVGRDRNRRLNMARNDHLLSVGNEALTPMTSAMNSLTAQIDQLTEVADARSSARLATLKTRMENFSASVTMVGQVKAGKSSIVNILAGRPALLPSDVNPWTSVVTTLNINTRTEGDKRAKFTFFEQEEWDNLMVGGGRLGELANRAGADDEMDDIRRQIGEMKAKSESRLGSIST